MLRCCTSWNGDKGPQKKRCFERSNNHLKGNETGVTAAVTPVLSLYAGFGSAISDARYEYGQGSSCASLKSEASLQAGICLDKSSLSHIKLKYDAVFLLVLVPGIGFDYCTAHPLVESHGILIVRTAIAGKTTDSFFPAEVIQDRKGLFSDPSVLILL